METLLLIDAATPILQATILENWHIKIYGRSETTVAENLTNLIQKCLSSSNTQFEELEGIVYCCGPGSTLGIRATLMSIKVLKIFSKRKLPLFEYNSLDLGLKLNPNFDAISTYVSNGTLLLKYRNCESIIRMAVEEFPCDEKICFLDTRLVRNASCRDFATANYNIADANFNFMSICKPSSEELQSYTEDKYRKWDKQTFAKG